VISWLRSEVLFVKEDLMELMTVCKQIIKLSNDEAMIIEEKDRRDEAMEMKRKKDDSDDSDEQDEEE